MQYTAMIICDKKNGTSEPTFGGTTAVDGCFSVGKAWGQDCFKWTKPGSNQICNMMNMEFQLAASY